MNNLEVLQRKIAATDTRLIRDHDESVASMGKLGKWLGYVWEDRHLVWMSQIVTIFDDGSVSVEKYGWFRHGMWVSLRSFLDEIRGFKQLKERNS
jgi:hypothetical protein